MVAQNLLRICLGKQVLLKYVSAHDLNKCLDQIKLPILPYTCVPFSELPSKISTMYERVSITPYKIVI